MNLPKQVTDFQTATRETLAPLAKSSFEGLEKLTALNVAVAGQAVAASASQAKAMLTATDPKSLLGALYNPQALNDTVAYFQQVMAIAKDSGSTLTQLVEKQLAEGGKIVNSAIDSMTVNAPAGVENLVSLVKSSMSAANGAFAQANVAAKQAAEQIETTVTKATRRVASAVKAAA